MNEAVAIQSQVPVALMLKWKTNRSISLVLFLMTFLSGHPLTAGFKKFPLRMMKFGTKKTAAAGGALAGKVAKKTATTAAGAVAHQTVRTAVK